MEQVKLSLEFTVDNFSFEDIKDKRFAKGVIHAFADGENANTWPIKTEVLTECANSVYDIPVVCKYNGFVNDFMSHERDEVPIGFIKETSPTYSNPIVFEKNYDGRTFIVIKCLIWKKYAKNAMEVLRNSRGKKAVSVELTVSKGEEIDGKIRVDEFVLDGITVLGDYVTPAVKDARIQVEFAKNNAEFAKDKAEYLKDIGFSDNTNKETGEMKMTENETQNCAVVEEEATPACEQCAAAEPEVKEADSNVACAEDTDNASDEQKEEMTAGAECAAEGSESACNCAAEPENGEGVNCAEDTSDDDDKEEKPDEDEDESEDEDKEEDKDEDKEEKMSLEAAMSKIEEMSSRVAELEAQNKAFMSKIEEMADYAELKQYKSDMEAKIKQDADMAAMNAVMSDITSRGYTMSDSEKNELIAKFSEFDSADAWANYVKAQAFDKVETAGVQRIGLPFAETTKTNSIWDLI